MTQRIVISHSFRGGTGKTTVTANLASYLAENGYRCMIFDTDLISPGIHALFGLDRDHMDKTLTEYLSGKAKLQDIVYDVSETLGVDDEHLLLVPASMTTTSLATRLAEKKRHNLLRKAIEKLSEEYDPDVVFIDTHPGIGEELLLAASYADDILVVVRPDNQDYQGLEVSADVFQKLDAKPIAVINKAPDELDTEDLAKKLKKQFKVPVVGALPFDFDVMGAESSYIFTLKEPQNAFSEQIRAIAQSLFGVEPREHLGIMRDILEAITKGVKDLEKSTHLTKKVAKQELDYLLKRKYITKKKGSYSITQHGKEFLEKYGVISKFVEEFQL